MVRSPLSQQKDSDELNCKLGMHSAGGQCFRQPAPLMRVEVRKHENKKAASVLKFYVDISTKLNKDEIERDHFSPQS